MMKKNIKLVILFAIAYICIAEAHFNNETTEKSKLEIDYEKIISRQSYIDSIVTVTIDSIGSKVNILKNKEYNHKNFKELLVKQADESVKFIEDSESHYNEQCNILQQKISDLEKYKLFITEDISIFQTETELPSEKNTPICLKDHFELIRKVRQLKREITELQENIDYELTRYKKQKLEQSKLANVIYTLYDTKYKTILPLYKYIKTDASYYTLSDSQKKYIYKILDDFREIESKYFTKK